MNPVDYIAEVMTYSSNIFPWKLNFIVLLMVLGILGHLHNPAEGFGYDLASHKHVIKLITIFIDRIIEMDNSGEVSQILRTIKWHNF